MDNDCLFRFVLKDPPRNWTKKQYKYAMQWLRIAKRHVEQQYSEKIRQTTANAMVFGTYVTKLSESGEIEVLGPKDLFRT